MSRLSATRRNPGQFAEYALSGEPKEPEVVHHDYDFLEPARDFAFPKAAVGDRKGDVLGGEGVEGLKQRGQSRAKSGSAQHDSGGAFSLQRKQHSKPANGQNSQDGAR